MILSLPSSATSKNCKLTTGGGSNGLRSFLTLLVSPDASPLPAPPLLLPPTRRRGRRRRRRRRVRGRVSCTRRVRALPTQVRLLHFDDLGAHTPPRERARVERDGLSYRRGAVAPRIAVSRRRSWWSWRRHGRLLKGCGRLGRLVWVALGVSRLCRRRTPLPLPLPVPLALPRIIRREGNASVRGGRRRVQRWGGHCARRRAELGSARAPRGTMTAEDDDDDAAAM